MTIGDETARDGTLESGLELTADEVIAHLELEPMPLEGGLWRQTWRDESSSSIYFLMQPDDFSAMHRLSGPELWHFYAGAPAEMLLLEPQGGISVPRLGCDLTVGDRPFVPVDAGVWMGAATTGPWTLVGTTMAPPFTQEGFELGLRELLCDQYPSVRSKIEALTRREPA